MLFLKQNCWITGAFRYPQIVHKFSGLTVKSRSFPHRLYSDARTNLQRDSTKFDGRYSAVVFTSILLSGYLGYTLATYRERSRHVSLTDENYGSTSDFAAALHALQKALPESGSIETNLDIRQRHNGFAGTYSNNELSHLAVVYPKSTEDVQAIVRIANLYKIPVTAYAGGTSLEGQVRATQNGICVDLSRMNKILEIHEEDSDLVCQAGCLYANINDTLKEKGIPLFFPLDPSAGATIGGMISTGCSGTNAVCYGTAKGEWFLNVTVVLPSGEVIKTRSRARKSSAGFDLTKLFIGAEGTLGIITEATLKLAPVLQTTVAVAQFPDIRSAAEAVRAVMKRGVGIQGIEICDSLFMHAINVLGSATGRVWQEKDSLFFKVQGHTTNSLNEEIRVISNIVKEYGATNLVCAKSDKEAEDLWTDRRNGLYAGLALAGNSRAQGWPTDVCVPLSKLPDLISETRKDIDKSGLTSILVGHAGDGNFHALLLFSTEEEKAIARELAQRIVHRAQALDGTCTGEHGVGAEKKKYLYAELGQGTVDLMRAIKRMIDPHNLFNPGKLYPDLPSVPGQEISRN